MSSIRTGTTFQKHFARGTMFNIKSKRINRALILILTGLRVLLWIAIIIEGVELFITKDVSHLAMSAIFFLLANVQVGLSRLLISMQDPEMAEQFLFISFFMISAAIIEIVDLGLDRAVSQLSNSPFYAAFLVVSFIEFLTGVIATLLAGYSLDRMFMLMRQKAWEMM